MAGLAGLMVGTVPFCALLHTHASALLEQKTCRFLQNWQSLSTLADVIYVYHVPKYTIKYQCMEHVTVYMYMYKV